MQAMRRAYIHTLPSAGIAATAWRPTSNREGPKPPDLNPIPLRQSGRDLAEYGVDGRLHIAKH